MPALTTTSDVSRPAQSPSLDGTSSAPRRRSPPPVVGSKPTTVISTGKASSPTASETTPTPRIPSPPPKKSDAVPPLVDNPPTPEPPTTDSTEELPEIINMEIFSQIIELDDDDLTHDFSHGMVKDYFVQAEQTFKDMAGALEKKDLTKLSQLGHFLKGSSAAIGVCRVQLSCERIQHYGSKRHEQENRDITHKEAIKLITDTLARVQLEYKDAKSSLEKWFSDNIEEDS